MQQMFRATGDGRNLATLGSASAKIAFVVVWALVWFSGAGTDMPTSYLVFT